MLVSSIAGLPTGDEPVPDVVRALAEGEPIQPVWHNEAGGLTFRLGADRFVKWTPTSSGSDLSHEAARLAWASAFTPVPRVLDQGSDGGAQWLVTAALPGESAVSPRWLDVPDVAVRAIGEGLRALHERLPVDDCPFDWGIATRLRGVADETLRAELADAPEPSRLVVCHGDACAPNTLIGPDGRWSAHVDLGGLGIADPWADLAIAAWSTEWNYGPGWEDLLYEAYGLPADPVRISYYRRLWDAT